MAKHAKFQPLCIVLDLGPHPIIITIHGGPEAQYKPALVVPTNFG